MPAVSIIIVFYNCEKKIKECLNSIFEQESTLDYEILLIDDSSAENKSEIIRNEIKNRQNIRYIVLREHVSECVARNIGIQQAKGDYLFFIDPRDTITKSCLNVLSLEIKKRDDVDVLLFMYRYYNDNFCNFDKISLQDSFIYNSADLPLGIFQLKTFPQLLECKPYIWNSIYRKKFIEENKIRFYGEQTINDMLFKCMSLVRAKRIRTIHDVLYTHTIGAESDFTGPFDVHNIDEILSIKDTDLFFQKENNVPRSFIISYTAQKLSSVVEAIENSTGQTKARFVDFIKEQIMDLDVDATQQIKNHRLSTDFLKNYLTNIDHAKIRDSLFKSHRLLLSIVIPVYNTEQWLRNCLRSVVNQTLPPCCFEVILVDDKSTDHSADVCHEFCERYSNFHLIALPENTPGGAGIPSNKGLDMAQGEYVGFVDSDDFIEPTMFEELLCKAIETQADLTLCGFNLFYEKAQTLEASYDQKAWHMVCKMSHDKEDFRVIREETLLHISPVPWRKLYRREFLNQHHIRYPEGKYAYEDNPLHWFCLTQAHSLAFVDKPLITHRFEREGQTMEAGLAKRAEAMMTHAGTIRAFLSSIGKLQEFRLVFIRWVLAQKYLLPHLGKVRKPFLKRMRICCQGTSLRDMLSIKTLAHQRLSEILYEFMLTKGQYKVGRILRYAAQRYAKVRDLLRSIFC